MLKNTMPYLLFGNHTTTVTVLGEKEKYNRVESWVEKTIPGTTWKENTIMKPAKVAPAEVDNTQPKATSRFCVLL